MKLDSHYSIRKEFCGFAKAQWVARFCGDWLGSSPKQSTAKTIASQHRALFLSGLTKTHTSQP